MTKYAPNLFVRVERIQTTVPRQFGTKKYTKKSPTVWHSPAAIAEMKEAKLMREWRKGMKGCAS